MAPHLHIADIQSDRVCIFTYLFPSRVYSRNPFHPPVPQLWAPIGFPMLSYRRRKSYDVSSLFGCLAYCGNPNERSDVFADSLDLNCHFSYQLWFTDPKKKGLLYSPISFPVASMPTLFLQWWPPLQPPGFEPVTFGSQVQLPNHVATAAAFILPLKQGVISPLPLCYCPRLGICPSPDHFIVGAQLQSSYHYEISYTYSLLHNKSFGVFVCFIFGQAQ